MKNEHELNDLWPDILSHGTASLKPDFARRVLLRAAAFRDEISPSAAWTIGLSTAFACLALTLAINMWNARRQSDKVIAQWSAFVVEDSIPDQEI
jgi:hypothetical protein